MSRLLLVGLAVTWGWLPDAAAASQTVVGNDQSPVSGAEVRAQNSSRPSSLHEPARLNVAGIPLAAALSELAERSGVLIAYSPSRLSKEGMADCDCATLTVSEALDRLLAPTLYRYTEVDRHVVILPRPMTVPSGGRDILPAVEPPVHFAVASLPMSRTEDVVVQASIQGIVTDAGTGGAISGATIRIEGTGIGTTTNAAGRYMLREVPTGTQRIAVSVIGYSSQSQTVTVISGEALTVNFTLAVAPLLMDQLVVTATGERRRAEVANVVATVDADAVIRTAPIATMSQLLTARSPSVQVVPVAGTVGGQTRIRIRGQSSLSLTNDPVVYLDGIRMETGYGGGMDTASRLDDINPAEIQTVEVLKGPAAVALYGTDAANGVIILTSKRGGVGAARWNVFVETGMTEQPKGFPSSYYMAGRTTATDVATQCLLVASAAGTCVRDELRTFNVLEDPGTSPFDLGRMTQTGVQLSGGSEEIRYFFSGDFSDQLGTLRMPQDEQERLRAERGVAVPRSQLQPNALRAINLRSNVTIAVSPTARMDFSAGYVTRNHRLTTSGGSITFGMTGTAMRVRGRLGDEGFFWDNFPVGDLFAHEELHSVGRLTGGVGTTWNPTTWLTTRARIGVDKVNQENAALVRADEGRGTNREGSKSEARIGQANYTADVGASALASLSEAIALRSSIGVQYFRTTTHSVNASGSIFSPGTVHIGGTATRSSGESKGGAANLGAYAEQLVAFNDRLFVTGSLRTDQHSAFGTDLDAVFYPRASVSWVASQEPFFPEISALESLRFRLAYGASGVSPGTTHALRFFSSVRTFDEGSERAGLHFQAMGNVDLKPERINEVEMGVDVEFLNGRATAELTHYRKTSTDALMNRPLPPSLGSNSLSRFENVGSVQNIGWEGVLFVRPIERTSWWWDATLSASKNENELIKLGEGVTPSVTFAGTRTAEGYPLWGRWAQPILSWGDANGDGIIEPHEVQVGDEAIYLGQSTPTREVGLSSSLTMRNGLLRVGALLDHRGGFLQYNRTEADRCTNAINCRAVNDPTAPLWEQARAVAASSVDLGRTHAGYFEDGAYTVLREASLSIQLPGRFPRLVGASETTVTLAGRNLHTWTKYSGVSPEGSWVDSMGLDMNLVPLSRYWTIRINATY